MKLIFLGSPAEVLPLLKKLMDLEQSHEHQLLAVVSQPAKPFGRKRKLQDPPVAAFAKENHILCLQPAKATDSDFLDRLRELDADVMITAAYGQILSDEFLAIPKRATINIHPSDLPKYRGATPVQSALFDGCEQTAVTILFTVRKLDAGALICRKGVAIGATETCSDLLAKLFMIGAELLPDALKALENPSFTGTPQDERQVTHCRKIQKQDGKIDWQQSAASIFNQYRAFFPWPGSFTYHRNKRILITGMHIPNERPADLPMLGLGEFFYTKPHQQLWVGCGQDTMIAVTKLKPEGSKELDATAFWNGVKAHIDTRGVFC